MGGFSSLPAELQRLPRAADERHRITVTSIDRLVGGWSGAAIHLVSFAGVQSGAVEHCVLELDRLRLCPGS